MFTKKQLGRGKTHGFKHAKAHVSHAVCKCRRRGEVEKRRLTLTFLKKFFLSSTFDLDSEALVESGS
jgi:hypothetical protein